MRIQEEIFDDFLLKLAEDENVPNKTIEELKKLWLNGIWSEGKILTAIEGGIKNRNKNQIN